jgi:ADP-heptose:LPS heptosyltransferase
MLFWSPGESDNPLHPGDDAKAEAIMRELPGIPILAYPTRELGQLIGGLSICDAIICSDGGAMHLAAGLGKPILCFFGKSDVTRWHPWSVPYVLRQKPSLEVTDISVEDALNGFRKLVAS